MKVITIGRSSQNEVTIHDGAVSRHHCQIVQYDNGTFAIVDFGSTNGTFVNGQRVQGQRPLNYGDVVKIGNTTIPWQNYFSSSTPTPRPNPYKPPKKTTALPVVLGVAGGLLLVALIILLLVKNRTNQESTSHPTICIDNAYIDFGMPLEDIRKQNPNANITPYHVNAVQNNAIYMQELNYYTINNETAIILINNSVAQIFTWSRSYRTLQNTQVGCTMGEVEQACPQLQFFYMGYSYNFRMQKYERAIRAYDPVSCIGYYFYESQFSQQQWSKLYAVAGKVSANGTFSMASVSSSAYQSIRSSVTVSIIEIGNCGSTSNVPQQPQEGSGNSARPEEKASTHQTLEFFCCKDINYVIPKTGKTRMDPNFHKLFAASAEARDRLISREESTYKSFVFISFCWDYGDRGRGKIVNVTDDFHKYKIVYTDASGNEYKEEVEVKPRTFSRMLPLKINRSEKIVLTELF